MRTLTHESYLTAGFDNLGAQASAVSTVMIESVGLLTSEWLSLLEVRFLLPTCCFFSVSVEERAAVCMRFWPLFGAQDNEAAGKQGAIVVVAALSGVPTAITYIALRFGLNLFLPGIVS